MYRMAHSVERGEGEGHILKRMLYTRDVHLVMSAAPPFVNHMSHKVKNPFDVSSPNLMAAMARQSRIWKCNTISFASKLYESPVTSILLSGCEAWALLADSDKKKLKRDPGLRNQMPDEALCL